MTLIPSPQDYNTLCKLKEIGFKITKDRGNYHAIFPHFSKLIIKDSFDGKYYCVYGRNNKLIAIGYELYNLNLSPHYDKTSDDIKYGWRLDQLDHYERKINEKVKYFEDDKARNEIRLKEEYAEMSQQKTKLCHIKSASKTK